MQQLLPMQCTKRLAGCAASMMTLNAWITPNHVASAAAAALAPCIVSAAGRMAITIGGFACNSMDTSGPPNAQSEAEQGAGNSCTASAWIVSNCNHMDAYNSHQWVGACSKRYNTAHKSSTVACASSMNVQNGGTSTSQLHSSPVLSLMRRHSSAGAMPLHELSRAPGSVATSLCSRQHTAHATAMHANPMHVLHGTQQGAQAVDPGAFRLFHSGLHRACPVQQAASTPIDMHSQQPMDTSRPCGVARALQSGPSFQHGFRASRSLMSPLPSRGDPTGSPAFVFDIDGVLIRGKGVLPTARKAMAKLCPGGQWKYPVCFLTNGGGMLEDAKAYQLASWLDAPVDASQIILSHTPMRHLVPELKERPVLVSGRGSVSEVAEHYGFKRVLSTYQLGRAMPSATPFTAYPGGQFPAPCPVRDLGMGTAAHPIEAVLVMNDPDDWYRDLQLITDVVLSGGVPERRGVPPQGMPPVRLYFSNPDLLWANEFPCNRFGQGAFAYAVQALHARVVEASGGAAYPPLNVKFFGKPNPEPYRMAEELLLAQAAKMGLTATTAAALTQDDSLPSLPFSGIYAVGDNPAADVRGANAAGSPWVSVLVQTGVFQGPGKNCAVDAAAVVVQCVDAAVDAALHRARSARFHSMR